MSLWEIMSTIPLFYLLLKAKSKNEKVTVSWEILNDNHKAYHLRNTTSVIESNTPQHTNNLYLV